MELPPFWQVTPLTVVAVVLLVAHQTGLRRLARRQRPERQLEFLRRSWLFTLGMAVLALVSAGPLERWSMSWLSVHMVVHVIEMFYLPPLLILSAPRVPLLFALPVTSRRAVLCWYYRSRSAAPLRGASRAAHNPILAVIGFNVVMVTWHLPVVFDWASWHDWAMSWLMGPSFILSGLAFWRVVLPSGHRGATGTTRVQVAGIIVTAFEMLVLAMSLAIFTKAPWYSMNVEMVGRAAALRDQHWAAGILWVCGDLWAVPALVVVLQRAVSREGGLSVAFERALGRAA